jgi:hypothetical protein
MPLPKGKTNNPNGRPAGGKNLKTVQWEALGEAIITVHAERFNTILAELEEEKFVDTYTKILEYFKPKLQRQTIEGGEKPLQYQELSDNDLEQRIKELEATNKRK